MKDRIKEFIRVPSSEIDSNPGNWRKHPSGQLEVLKGILEEVGIAGALIAYYSPRNHDRLTLIDGELRKEDFPADWPVLVLDVNDEEADKLMVTFDPISALAVPDYKRLAGLLEGMKVSNTGLQDFLNGMAKESKAMLEEMMGHAQDGTILNLVDVSIKDPDHKVKEGEVYSVGPHTLICAEVFEKWGAWKKLLKAGMMFCPFPGPFVILSNKATVRKMLLVQPDPYICGHILDHWAAVMGEETISQVNGETDSR